MFWDSLSVLSSRVKNFMKKGMIGHPKLWVRNYHHKLPNAWSVSVPVLLNEQYFFNFKHPEVQRE